MLAERRADEGRDSSGGITFECLAQRAEIRYELGHLAVLQIGGSADAAHNFRCPCTELTASIGQADADLTFVGRTPGSPDVTEGFQSLQHRRQGIRLQRELAAKLSDGLVVVVPQKNHRNELRVGEVELLEQWLVNAVECVAGRINGKAQETLELEGSSRRSLGWAPLHGDPDGIR